ncbi:zinc finger (CCCH-type/C3HC4-type RING finger) family protein [Actinidia rufa]|uniref:Zinc finger (CCCH-type/C3HC4-type RING finger) family protein n=1 Tax=Actinidia rufa TaxID=165716 RepID=A0A7J0DZ90_9ERIC|nr:zinc finger (CCCH-type/C3HC4-type RING finger) family protein [Actinidia rufa]
MADPNESQNQSDQESITPMFQFESSKEIQVQDDGRATATLETETEFSKDARAIRERVLKQAEEALKGKGKNPADEKLYKGIHGYTDYKAGFRREQKVSAEKAGGSHGPLRASAHIRVTARQPFVDPVVTKCKHYFCEHCALKHHAKNKKCFVCNKPTDGIFNTAHEIKKKIAADGK